MHFYDRSFAPDRLGVDILYLCAILFVSEANTRTIVGFTLVACLLILIDEDIFLTKATIPLRGGIGLTG